MIDPFRDMDRPFTRRRLLRSAAAGGIGLSLPGLLAACGGGGIEGADTVGPTTTVARELADQLVFANWPLYIDVDEESGERPTLAQFTQQTGVAVEYLEEVNDNDEWFGKYQAQLSAGDDIGRDIVVLTDWMAGRMVRLGYVQQLDKEAIPNMSNLQDALRSPGWDPERQFSVPWQSGLTGIVALSGTQTQGDGFLRGHNGGKIFHVFGSDAVGGSVVALINFEGAAKERAG